MTMPIPTGNQRPLGAAELRRADRAHVLHPVSAFSQLRAHGPLIFDRGDGIRLWDVEGREYLDAFSGLMNVNVGYGRETFGDIAREQLSRLHFSPMFFGRAVAPAIELASALAEVLPAPVRRLHFTSSGSEANETAIKLARLYFHALGEPERTVVISRRNSYHGMTYAAMAATGIDSYHQGFGPVPPGFVHIAPDSAEALEAEILRQGPGRVAAFLAEPIALPAGVWVPGDDYWPAVRRICDKHGVLLICDEVVTGFGRTGALFASEHWGIAPDLLTMAKGLTSGYAPLGAVAMSDAVGDVIEQELPVLMHGFTSSGHAVSCAIALENLRILLDERLSERAAERGAALRARLREAIDDRHLREVRGLGLMTAVELRGEDGAVDLGARVIDPILARGVMVRPYGNAIVVGPPLVIDERDVEVIAHHVAGGVDAALGAPRQRG